ncbi:MAG: 2-phospho-L-lactate transferase [Rhodospirillaceae bacterium]|nr:MAG: 2-phospho-L-lactate transferase [Rhodospirillaceae bacterium]
MPVRSGRLDQARVSVGGRVTVLTGGVGGAKLVLGLTRVMPPGQITAIINTGDDFRHLGLWVSPDIDTLLYTLSGRSNEERGWGRAGETWNFIDALRSLGGEDWFALGDGDLALHVERTRRLAQGDSLSAISAAFAQAWGLTTHFLPMSDDGIATFIDTAGGELAFQRYFVEHRCQPAATGIRFVGAAAAKPAPGVLEAITGADTDAIIIAPSNPFLSIDPILAVPAIADALRRTSAPCIAVSPIVGGQAVKGPTVKLMTELGIAITPVAIASHYEGIIDALLIDQRDLDVGPTVALPHAYADTLMKTLADRERVARAALSLAREISQR